MDAPGKGIDFTKRAIRLRINESNQADKTQCMHIFLCIVSNLRLKHERFSKGYKKGGLMN